jgi:hypothetical protein
MNFVKPGNIETDDFFTLNPSLKYLEPFSKIKDSRLMWSIWMWCDPSPDNKLYRINPEARLIAIKRYCKKFDIEDTFIKECIDAYSNYYLLPAARAFKEMEELLVSRKEILTALQDELKRLASTNPMAFADKDTIALMGKVESMHANTLKISMLYAEARKVFEEEVVNPKVYGGRQETIREKGELIIPKEDYE